MRSSASRYPTAAIANSRRVWAVSFPRLANSRSVALVQSVRSSMARPMANDPPFATLNHSAADLGTPESQTSRGLVLELAMSTRYAVVNLAVITIGFCAAYWEQ